MGDDNEIRQLIKRQSESSLNRALVEIKGMGKAYDFEYEFAKTKKNRTFLVAGATLATILALGGAAFGVARLVQMQTAASPVDVRAFDDLNLKDLLDSAKRNETNMDRAKQDLARLDYELKAGLDTADRDYAAAVELIKARNYPASEEAARIAAAAAARDEQKRKLRAAYAVASEKLKAQIAAIQKEIDKYDQRLMDQANKQKAVLDNQRRAFEIEKKKQTDYYEGRLSDLERRRKTDVADLTKQRDDLAASLTARYNPTYADARAIELLRGYVPPKDIPQGPPYPPYLASAGVLDAAAASRLDRSIADFQYLSGRLRAVPYINSVPPALARMEAEVRSSVAAYRGALAQASGGLESRDARIRELEARARGAEAALARYNWVVTAFVQENREGGYILDPRDPENILVALNPALPVVDGTVGYVVRDDKSVATIEFRVASGTVTARLAEAAAGLTLRPFDTILVHADSRSAP